jgi:hypothetical protein
MSGGLILELYVSSASSMKSLALRREIETVLGFLKRKDYQFSVISSENQMELFEKNNIIFLPVLICHSPPPRREIVGHTLITDKFFLTDWLRIRSKIPAEQVELWRQKKTSERAGIQRDSYQAPQRSQSTVTSAAQPLMLRSVRQGARSSGMTLREAIELKNRGQK